MNAAFAQMDSIATVLRSIDTLYSTGSYLSAEVEARRLLEQSALSDSVRIAAHKYIAFGLIAQEKPNMAREHFLEILSLDSAFSLDPVYTSPKILIVFSEARQTILNSKKNPRDTFTIRSLQGRPSITFRTVIFPGWEQLHSGRSTGGYVFLSAGILTLGSGVTFAILKSSARKDYLAATQAPAFDEKYSTYDSYYKAEIASFISFAVVYLTSEIEVFAINHDSPVSLQTTFSQESGPTVTLAFSF